ncbi:hypothetical protein DSO57_1019100 [Entomophthora muscae]|uniref:Uncharacterized protein n=1 Tax=Entomophthora muscae TaxID=34485 RepID=A0ACC2UD11_9FUNG|nr:hypothetical protein DSO57_1019100 [Entomophthora muscae]
MVYVTLRQKRGSWAIDITLLLLIGVSDILAGLVAVVLQFWKLNSSYTAAYAGSHWCYANAVLSHSTLLTTITLTALLALVRYLTIVRGKSVSNRICTVAAMFLISLCWASSVAKGVLSDSVLDPSGFVCSLSDKTNWHISAAIYIGMALPFFTIPVCYLLLTYHFRKLVRQMRRKYSGVVPKGFQMRFDGMVLVVILYILAIFPEYTLRVIIFAFQVEVSPWLISAGRICTFSLTIFNAVFALIYHEDINRELLRLIERHDSRSLEVLTQPPYDPDQCPKLNPNRTSAFLYFQ